VPERAVRAPALTAEIIEDAATAAATAAANK